MTKDIEQQARKEAEEKYLFPDDDHPSQDEDYTVTDIVLAERDAYAAALISERSKPSATCEPICGDHGGIEGCSCSNCSTPIGPHEFSRYCGNCGRKVIWPEGANYRQRRE